MGQSETIEKYERNVEKYPLRPPCSCYSNCSTKVPQERRQAIWGDFWEMNYNSRKQHLWSMMKRTPTKKAAKSRRRWNVAYFLLREDGTRIQVCKIFFLGTFGFSKSSSVISELLKTSTSMISPEDDKRGKHTPHHALKGNHLELLRDHFMSYSPCISHCRGQYGTRRFYLPDELKAKAMHKDFNEKHPDNTCSYVTYYRKVQEFGKLKTSWHTFMAKDGEDCHHCRELSKLVHQKSNRECTDACDGCLMKRSHIEAYMTARDLFQKDIQLSRYSDISYSSNEVIRDVGLQNGVMLPRLSGVTPAYFTKRLVVFHLVFYKSRGMDSRTISMIWHEGVAGRKCEEITSMYCEVLHEDRNYDHITYWMDNWVDHNKSWSLLTAMVRMVNSNHIKVQTVTFKYHEEGHRTSKLDSAVCSHGEVVDEMRRKGNVYDIEDFTDCVNKALYSGKVIRPANEDFLNHKGEQNDLKLSENLRVNLSEMRQIKFFRGMTSLYYKNRHDDVKFIELDFLNDEINLSEFPGPLRERDRGIPEEKKRAIQQNLLPLIPDKRKAFWNEIPTANVPDLLGTDDD